MKPKYSPEITFGNVLVILGLLLNAGLMEIPRESDVKVMQKDVTRHELMLKELTASQQLIAANLQVLTAIVNERLKVSHQP